MQVRVNWEQIFLSLANEIVPTDVDWALKYKITQLADQLYRTDDEDELSSEGGNSNDSFFFTTTAEEYEL